MLESSLSLFSQYCQSHNLPIARYSITPYPPLPHMKEFVLNNLWTLANLLGAAVVLFWAKSAGLLSLQAWQKPLRDTKPHPTSVWIACAVMVWMTGQVSGSIFLGLTKLTPDTTQLQVMIATCIYVVSISVGAVLIYLLQASAPNSGLRTSITSTLRGGVLLGVSWPVLTVVGFLCVYSWFLVTGEKPQNLGHPTLRSLVDDPTDPWVWALASLAIIAAPIQEEIIYRGLLQSALLRATNRIWFAVGASSLIFALAHLGTVPNHALPSLFMLSVCIGFAFERTRSLGVAIGMHVAFNAANVALALMTMK
jgi:membrane protease YdiL (CAAX protease family)